MYTGFASAQVLTMTMANDPCVTVYGLSTSTDARVRYIGQTISPLNIRLCEHLSRVRTGKRSKLYSWIRKHQAAGEMIVITPIVVGAIYHETEMRLIAEYRERGADLVNSTIGGDGIIGLVRTAEHQKKIADANRGRKRGPHSAEHRQKIADAQRGQRRAPLTEEMKQRLSEILKKRVFSDEHRRRISEKRKAQGISPETQAKMREGRISSPLWRASCGRKPHSKPLEG